MHHDNGIATVRVNQEIDGERWYPLGTYDFGVGAVNKVVLTNHANEYVIADAIKFEQVSYEPVKTVAADAARFTTNDAEAASVRYVHPDHLGSPQKMTDASGAVVWSAAFTPFGRDPAITGAATNNNRFPGQYYDLETSLNYNYWRDYDPTTGRYVQSDPMGTNGGLNIYAYAAASPTQLIDPLGLKAMGAPGIQTAAYFLCQAYWEFHYFFGNGRPVYVGWRFWNAPDVRRSIREFKGEVEGTARDIARSQCANCSSKGVKRVRFQTNDKDITDVTSVPCLFAVGNSTFFRDAKCGVAANCDIRTYGFACTLGFEIKDEFADPLDIGVEIPPGVPYPILGKMKDILVGGGKL